MKLRGLTAKQVDAHVDAFHALMLAGMEKICANAANHMLALTADGASDGELSAAVDALGVMSTQWDAYSAEVLMPALANVTIDAGKVVTAPLGSVHVPDVNTGQFLEQMHGWVTALAGDMWQAAKTSLIAGAQDGATMTELASSVEQVAQVKSKKAHTIAQTAVVASINGGEWRQVMKFANAFDVKGMKEWEATEDSHTRPAHHAADGQRVPIEGHFTVGGEFMLFPGDPSASASQVANCRCTTLYDLDVEDQITASQTSPEPHSEQPTTVINGPISVSEMTLISGNDMTTAFATGLTAAWNPAEHPRGKDGKFIQSGVGLPEAVLNILKYAKSGDEWGDLHNGNKNDFLDGILSVTAKQWHNLKDEDQAHIKKLLEDAVDEGAPGSAHDQMHIDELDDAHVPDVEDNVFDVNTPLPPASSMHVAPSSPPVTGVPPLTTGSSAPIKITHGLIHAKHNKGDVIAQSSDGLEIEWNGTSYDIVNGDGEVEHSGVKKSKLYALLNTQYTNAKWHKPGKQETEVSHAAPLDAAPAPAHVPHPVSPTSLTPVGPMGTSPAFKHVYDTGQDMYSTNGKVKLSKAPNGVIMVSKKQSDGTWDEPHLPWPGEVPPSTKWKNTEGAASSSIPWAPIPGLANDNSDPFAGLSVPTVSTPSTPIVAQKMDLTGWKKVGGQGGSNLGGLYEAPDGQRYYVKSLKSEDHAKNEVLAASLYKAAGINVPEVRHGENHPDGWKNVVVSKIVPDAKTAKTALTNGSVFQASVQNGYAVDAWLANHDVVGLSHDNIVKANGKAWRIDVGGSLLYRAQGGKKNFKNDPSAELNGLKDASVNPQAASVFGGMTIAEEKDSAKKLLGVTDAQIYQLTHDAGMPASLADTLVQRKKAILEKYGLGAHGDVTPASAPTTTTPDFLDTTGLSPAKLAEYDKLSEYYDKGLITEDELFQQIELLKNGPEPGDLATPASSITIDSLNQQLNELHIAGQLHSKEADEIMNYIQSGDLEYAQKYIDDIKNFNAPGSVNVSTLTPSGGVGIEPGTPLLMEDIEDLFNSAKTGDVLAVATSPTGVPYELLKHSSTHFSAKNTTNGIESWMDFSQLQKVTTSNSLKWKTPGTPSAPLTPSTATAADVPVSTKWTVYGSFKAEKVSPAWSGAKIYASMHAAKAKHSGDPTVAGLSDNEMLKLLDEVEIKKNGVKNGNTTPYSAKVKEWLKTPNGQKAFKQLNPAIPTSSMPTTPPTSFGHAAKKAAKKLAKKVAPGLSVTDALGDTDISTTTDTAKSGVYTTFKSGIYGKYLSSKPEDIYYNAVAQAKNLGGGFTPGQVLAIVDAEGAKKFGVTNANSFENKVKDWLHTPSGKKKAADIQAGTWTPGSSPASSSSFGSTYGAGSSYAHPANAPLSEKIHKVDQHVPPFDPNDTTHYADLTPKQAANTWKAMEAKHGAMTATQKSALKYYTTNSGYAAMNGYLRGKQGASDKLKKQVEDAQSGMRPSVEPMLLRRGSGWFTSGSTGQQWTSYANIKALEGGEFHNESFFSASVGGKAAFGGNIKFEIECPVGTPMAYVQAFSHYGSKDEDSHHGEREMLLAGDVNFKILRVTNDNGYVVVRMRAMASGSGVA